MEGDRRHDPAGVEKDGFLQVGFAVDLAHGQGAFHQVQLGAADHLAHAHEHGLGHDREVTPVEHETLDLILLHHDLDHDIEFVRLVPVRRVRG